MSNLLSVHDLHKSFLEGGEEIHVLRGLDVELSEGERLAIVGESGVGKSTLLHLLGGLDRATRGQILYQGKEIPMNDEVALPFFRNREIGFVFQFHYLLPDFSALENVMLPGLIRGMAWERAESEAKSLLESVGLANRVSHRPGKLSGGEQQRLILADEPTGDLDFRIGAEVQDLLFRFNEERGMALVVATHNREFAQKIGRQMELREGRLFAV
jgi:lipoprotein-releasing system ATP-binding protein